MLHGVWHDWHQYVLSAFYLIIGGSCFLIFRQYKRDLDAAGDGEDENINMAIENFLEFVANENHRHALDKLIYAQHQGTGCYFSASEVELLCQFFEGSP